MRDGDAEGIDAHRSAVERCWIWRDASFTSLCKLCFFLLVLCSCSSSDPSLSSPDSPPLRRSAGSLLSLHTGSNGQAFSQAETVPLS